MKIPLIEIKNVYKTYQAKKRLITALQGVSLTLHKGEIIGRCIY